MTDTRKPNPGLLHRDSIQIEPDSPYQAALTLVELLLSLSPDTDRDDPDSARAAAVIGSHFCGLRGCGSLNASGLHSAALVLYRSLQDALDVFVAVTPVAGAALKWEDDKLKPSEAAKTWIAERGDLSIRDAGGNIMSLSDYRRSQCFEREWKRLCVSTRSIDAGMSPFRPNLEDSDGAVMAKPNNRRGRGWWSGYGERVGRCDRHTRPASPPVSLTAPTPFPPRREA